MIGHWSRRRVLIAAAGLAACGVVSTVLVTTGTVPLEGNDRCDPATPPGARGGDTGFTAVAAGDERHVWAFGNRWSGPSDEVDVLDYSTSSPYAFRWDGRSWRRQDLPAGWPDETLAADSSGPHDLWTVGANMGDYMMNDLRNDYTTMHFDGTRWRSHGEVDQWLRPTADDPVIREVSDLEAAGREDAWLLATGKHERMGPLSDNVAVRNREPTEPAGLRALHFDGAEWRRVPAPRYGTELTALAGDDAIAVGTDGTQPTAERWDGEGWSRMTVPTQETSGEGDVYLFTDVHANSASDVWAVGRLAEPDSGETAADVADGGVLGHWNGTDWSVSLDTSVGAYNSVTGDGDGGLWLTRTPDGMPPEYPAIDGELVHRTADGTVTEFDLGAEGPEDTANHHSGERSSLEETAVAPVPGTRRLALAGSFPKPVDGHTEGRRSLVTFCAM